MYQQPDLPADAAMTPCAGRSSRRRRHASPSSASCRAARRPGYANGHWAGRTTERQTRGRTATSTHMVGAAIPTRSATLRRSPWVTTPLVSSWIPGRRACTSSRPSAPACSTPPRALAVVRRGCAGSAIAIPAPGGIGIALDPTTRTVYIAGPDNDVVSAIDTNTCNAQATSGCAEAHTSVPVGTFPGHLAVDPRVHTLYVANEGAEDPAAGLSLIDTSQCNGRSTSGCPTIAPTAAAGPNVDGLVVDSATPTLYTDNFGDSTESVIDTTICNAGNPAGCSSKPFAFAVPGGPTGGDVDAVTRTLLLPLTDSVGGPDIAGTVAFVDMRRCNTRDTSGCGAAPAVTKVGSNPLDVAVNARTRRAYVVNEEDSDVSVIDLTRCNAQWTRRCGEPSPTMAIDFDGGAVAVDTTTNTIYASSQDQDTVTALDGRTCNSDETRGCRHPAPTTDVGIGARGGVLDRHLDTLYFSNQVDNTISVLDPTQCGISTLRGCDTTWPTISVGESPKQLVDDEDHHTLYVGDYAGSAVSVIDTSSCNTQTQIGCGQTPPLVPVTGGAYDVAHDPTTNTLYAANVDTDTLTLIDTTSCNAVDSSACTETPIVIHIGAGPAGLLIDPTTRTLYVSVRGETRVAVVDIATCNVTDTAGCESDHPSIPISAGPRFLALDASTGTLYVSTRDNSTIAVVDAATCNARATTSCQHPPATLRTGLYPYGVTVDAANHQLIVGNVGDSTVTTYNTRTCNAHTTTGCATPRRIIETGGWPVEVTVDDHNGTLYISDNVDAQQSIVRL